MPKSPPIYLISAFAYILHSIYELGERNKYMCTTSSLFNCCASWIVYLALVFTIIEENDRIYGNSRNTKTTLIVIIITLIYFIIVFIIMSAGYGIDSELVNTLVDDISPLHHYKCKDENVSNMVYIFNV